jgi:LysR family glycine cleavage system transcriptional activator
MSRLPSLSALKAFEAVGRTGSVRAAGDELAVSHTVISRHLQNLQLDLGVELVEHRGRGLSLTPAGVALHAQVTQAFDTLRQAVFQARPAPRSRLDVWCIPGLANRRLMPRLPSLLKRLDGMEITLQPTLARPNFGSTDTDAEIVYLEEARAGPGLRTELLAKPRVLAVASPSFQARYPRITEPSGLVELPLIHEESTDQWERWLSAAGVKTMPILRGLRLWHAHLAIEAARLGQGVALANRLLVDEDVSSGHLVEIIPSTIKLGGYFLIGPEQRWRDPSFAVLRTWLKEVLMDDDPTGALEAPVRTKS